ncbi:MAG TPA: glycosyltransferase family 4 protein, partial [Candidatus Thermoplasmatota archaeon]|nr:glycosyltransferase family 4 protein [Candidatus Thermoplasmatota archaeon]
TYYAELLANQPEEIRLVPTSGAWGHPVPGGAAGRFAFWKARGLAHALGAPAFDWLPREAAAGRPVLSAQALPLHRGPWALDLDVVSALVGYRNRLLHRVPTRAWLRRRVLRPDCRAVTYWSDAARRGGEAYFGPGSEAKSLLLPPAVRERPLRRHTGAADEVHLVYVARRFDHKGGQEALDAALRVLEAHPRATATFVTRLPPGQAWPDHPRLRLRSDLPADELEALWAKADVFLYATRQEIFGLVVLEALAHGVPVVALDEFAIPEMARDGQEGLLVRGFEARWHDERMVPVRSFDEATRLMRPGERERVVADLARAADTLVRDPGLRRRLGESAWRRAREGPFSPPAQREALRALAARLSG